MTSIATAAADPVAFARRALSRAGQDVHAAAAGLLAAGVSLRRPTDGEVMLEFASGVTSSTTIRWVRTPEGGEISVNNPGQPYCPPGIPQSVLGNLRLGQQPAAAETPGNAVQIPTWPKSIRPLPQRTWTGTPPAPHPGTKEPAPAPRTAASAQPQLAGPA